MSPASSTTSVPSSKTMAPPPRPSHSRHTSVASGKQQLPPQQLHVSQTATKAPSPRPKSEVNRPNVHYTCFIRLPFQRNGFEDPSPQSLQPFRAGLGCYRWKVWRLKGVPVPASGMALRAPLRRYEESDEDGHWRYGK
ncbi:hypothetical protein KC333_g10 [Hortaea werneckii]|nr:hypothetical protein KC333_g10 [Hortaea werneckii]